MLDGLTFLRFVAALYVFCFHFDIRFAPSLSPFAKNIVANGAIAMPVFFMLSGFVLTYRHAHDYSSFARYYWARIARIYPAYMLCFLVSMPLLWGPVSLQSAHVLFSNVALMLVCLVLAQAWFPNVFHVWHVAGTWSVSVEMFLYALYPLSRRLAKLSSSHIFGVMALALAVSASIVPSLRLSFSRDLPFPVFYTIPVYRVPDFVFGCALATLFLRHGARFAFALPALLLVPLLGTYGNYNERFMMFNHYCPVK